VNLRHIFGLLLTYFYWARLGQLILFHDYFHLILMSTRSVVRNSGMILFSVTVRWI